MHFFDINQAKSSENDVKIASDKVKGLQSGSVLLTDPTNPSPVGNLHLRRPHMKSMDAIA